ncbi:uncharacterized protein TRAVEDRAFT_100228, partial [Trametes versicolor FP-101664 SS1]|uniref:uncharacterized protein n=1 Tax=Trametes versicolor (strain FP-101664) TaxID=717944 RepID=UPI000462452A
ALFCFDYCLTFGREVDFVWKRGLSVSTVLFYAARYPAFFSTIFVILDIVPFKGMSISVMFSSLRVYALWDRNRCVLAAVLLLGMANPAISIVR